MLFLILELSEALGAVVPIKYSSLSLDSEWAMYRHPLQELLFFSWTKQRGTVSQNIFCHA